MASQMMRSGVPVQQMAPQPILPGDQDAIIRTLNDVNQGDESKLKAVQDAWNTFDMFNVTPTFDQFLESLMRAFMKLFSETVPQFIQENNTQVRFQFLFCYNASIMIRLLSALTSTLFTLYLCLHVTLR
ncbi:hypothetical protein ANCCAN_27567 [Ancylostoma caninum]|uniref:Uncharacterized protein n=1 Tax=Ancylostoma caninum TaxID=29170 RepID=A0A368F3N2_ANCCA|nr:hypothetical protein ANCCAN_27567 [Ancylostoma caninum]